MITTKKPRRSVSSAFAPSSPNVSPALVAASPVFLEPIYLNPFRSPRVFTQPTCAIPMTSNAFAFAFVGLTALA